MTSLTALVRESWPGELGSADLPASGGQMVRPTFKWVADCVARLRHRFSGQLTTAVPCRARSPTDCAGDTPAKRGSGAIDPPDRVRTLSAVRPAPVIATGTQWDTTGHPPPAVRTKLADKTTAPGQRFRWPEAVSPACGG